jgi:hypothetical protein
MITREKVYADSYLVGRVRRYHTWPMLQAQTVGGHAWGVACIYVAVFGLPRAEVLLHCLHHDSGELWAGDLPFGVKNKIPGLKAAMDIAEEYGLRMLDIKLPELQDDEKVKIKICDLLEMHRHGWHEVMMGNQFAVPVMQDTASAAQALAGKHCHSESVNRWLEEFR